MKPQRIFLLIPTILISIFFLTTTPIQAQIPSNSTCSDNLYYCDPKAGNACIHKSAGSIWWDGDNYQCMYYFSTDGQCPSDPNCGGGGSGGGGGGGGGNSCGNACSAGGTKLYVNNTNPVLGNTLRVTATSPNNGCILHVSAPMVSDGYSCSACTQVGSFAGGPNPYDSNPYAWVYDCTVNSVGNKTVYWYSGAGATNTTACNGQAVTSDSRCNNTVAYTVVSPPGAFSLSGPSSPLSECVGSQPGVDLSWSTSNYATYYEVFRQPSGGSTTYVGTVNAPTTSYRDTTANPSTSYSYIVYAFNSYGSTASNWAGVTTSSCLSAPTSVTATPTCSGSSPQINVVYSGATGATYYQVIRSGTVASTNASSPFVDSGVSRHTNYSYTVKSCNGQQCVSSNPVLVTSSWCDSTPPTVILNFASECYQTSGNNSWPGTINATVTDDISGVAQVFYKIQRNAYANPPGSCYNSSTHDFSASCTTATSSCYTNNLNNFNVCKAAADNQMFGSGSSYSASIPVTDFQVGGSYPTAPDNGYTLQIKAIDNAGNVYNYATSTDFVVNNTCISPYLKTQQGDVHSNTQINTPGGPAN